MCSALLAQLYFCSKWPTGLMNIGRDGPMVWMYNKINLYSHSKICSSMLIHHGILLCASPPPPPHSCIILLRISQFDHFSTSPLKSDGSQLYPMHMKHNGASKTLLLLIDGVFPISDFIQCKLHCRRQQSGRTHPRSRPRPPRCHRTFQ